jgi:serine/threonine protein kinase
MLEALSQLHALGIVHRDVKPENIMCSNDLITPSFKLFDFSSAARAGSRDLDDPTGGTCGFFSPQFCAMYERYIRGGDFSTDFELHKCNDVFALGVTLFVFTEDVEPFDLGLPRYINYHDFTKPVTPTYADVQIRRVIQLMLTGKHNVDDILA